MRTIHTYALAIVAAAAMLTSCNGNENNKETDSLHVDSSVSVKTDTTVKIDTSAKDTLTTPDSVKLVVPENDTVGKTVTKEVTVKKKVIKKDN